MAFGYVAHAELTKGAPDERTILLDVTLCDALFKGVRGGRGVGADALCGGLLCVVTRVKRLTLLFLLAPRAWPCSSLPRVHLSSRLA